MAVLGKSPELIPARMRKCCNPTMSLPGWFGLLMLWLCFSDHVASAQVTHEYQLKAVFLYNFSRYTDWPPEAFENVSSPLVIGILGRDPFGPYLEEAVKGETVDHRPLRVERFKRIEDVKDVHILFISDSEAKRLPAILAKLQGRSILTVSDMNNFAATGGMVHFLTQSNKIHLQINLDALKAAKLTMSSKVLRAADKVLGEGGEK